MLYLSTKNPLLQLAMLWCDDWKPRPRDLCSLLGAIGSGLLKAVAAVFVGAFVGWIFLGDMLAALLAWALTGTFVLWDTWPVQAVTALAVGVCALIMGGFSWLADAAPRLSKSAVGQAIRGYKERYCPLVEYHDD